MKESSKERIFLCFLPFSDPGKYKDLVNHTANELVKRDANLLIREDTLESPGIDTMTAPYSTFVRNMEYSIRGPAVVFREVKTKDNKWTPASITKQEFEEMFEITDAYH